MHKPSAGKKAEAEESAEFTQRRTNVKQMRLHLEDIVKNAKAFTAAALTASTCSRNFAESMIRCGEAIRTEVSDTDALGVAMRTFGGAMLGVQESYQNFIRETTATFVQATSSFLDTDVKEYRARKKTYYKSRANYVNAKQKSQGYLVKEKIDPIRVFENNRQVCLARKSFFDLTVETENRMIIIEDAAHWFLMEKMQGFAQAFVDYSTDAYGTWHELEGYISALGEYAKMQHVNAEEDRRNRLDELKAREEERELYRYQPLIDMVAHPDMVLLNAICDSLRDDCDDILEKVLKITDGYNQSLPLIKVGITAEIQKTEDAATLFRSNNVHTKLITIYTKLVGQQFLEDTIGQMMADFIANPVVIEIDPNRLDFNMSEEEKKEIIDTNMNSLKRVCQGFFDRIINSFNQCPIPMREICNHLQREVWDRFPQNRQTAVGGYVFLRFFCPAIMAPDKNGLSKTPPDPDLQRKLILLTKVLQSISNLRQFGQKERFMAPMNEFINKNLDRTKDFFNSLSRLPPNLGDYSPICSLEEVHERHLPDLQNALTLQIDAIGRRLLDTHPEGRHIVQRVSSVLADLDPSGKVKPIVPPKK